MNSTLNHLFLIPILEKIGFGTEFIERLKVLLKNQEWRVINKGITSKYIKLERETQPSEPIPIYLLIIVREVVS